jgi:hypothetical protein
MEGCLSCAEPFVAKLPDHLRRCCCGSVLRLNTHTTCPLSGRHPMLREQVSIALAAAELRVVHLSGVPDMPSIGTAKSAARPVSALKGVLHCKHKPV